MEKSDLKKTKQCWSDMKQRCYNKNALQYKNYGARGISVCDRWLESFDNFLSDMGVKPNGMTIDRIDVNGNYGPSNCRWATNDDQQKNKRNCHLITFNGETLTRRDWAKKIGLHEATLQCRIKRGWPIEDVLDPKVIHRGRTSLPRKVMAAMKEQQ